MVYRCFQLVLPLVQAMQLLLKTEGSPPQTTNLPPDRRERVWPCLGAGKSGMEHVLLAEGGNTSTDESAWPLLNPPTTNCPNAKLINDQAIRK